MGSNNILSIESAPGEYLSFPMIFTRGVVINKVKVGDIMLNKDYFDLICICDCFQFY